jgi:hypothetical protein
MTTEILEHVRHQLKEFYAQLWAQYDLVDGSIFHYAPYASLEGILGSKALWLSDLLTVNDSTEVTYLEPIVHEIVRRKSVPSTVASSGESVGNRQVQSYD